MQKNQIILSTLWIFVTLNYLYCDLIGLMDSNLLPQYMQGEVEGMKINERFLLYAGILMEVPILMVLLARILKDKWNAWSNVIASFIKTLVMIGTLFIGNATEYYVFFAFIEISTTIFIGYYALRWLGTLSVKKA